MRSGFVYIMINPAFIRKVKIGTTNRSTSDRAKELSTTGVPEAFIVVHDELVSDCKKVEKILHEKFEPFRSNKRREFFDIPIKDAIKALIEISNNYKVQAKQINEKSILIALYNKYGVYLKKDITDIKIVHTDDVCFLEIIRNLSGYDQIIERIDLGFIVHDIGKPYFPLTNSIEDNCELFVNDFDAYSIINCTPIFTDEACEEIVQDHFKNDEKV